MHRSSLRVRPLHRVTALLILLATWLPACDRRPAPLWNVTPVPVRPAVRTHVLPEAIRAVWVARFHYRTAADIAEIMRESAALGFNTVLFQVRGTASVAYPSELEPWAEEFDDRNPGFDPLGVAVAEAHRHGLRVEAWINVMPAWRGKRPPANPAHLYHTRPEWFLHDARGRRQPLNDHYVILNPCRADVRDHIVAVAEEIVTRYAVAGLHLDYVRYAWEETPGAAQQFPGDPETLALYQRETGLRPADDQAAWSAWRTAQLTRLVVELRTMLARRRPDAALTAATWGNPERGLREYLQDAAGWLAAGVLDAAYPMVYRTRLADFENDLAVYDRLAPGSRLVPGLGIYLHREADQTRAQLDRCAARGGDWALFSFETLSDIWKDRLATRPDAARASQQAWLRAVLAEFVDKAPPSP